MSNIKGNESHKWEWVKGEGFSFFGVSFVGFLFKYFSMLFLCKFLCDFCAISVQISVRFLCDFVYFSVQNFE